MAVAFATKPKTAAPKAKAPEPKPRPAPPAPVPSPQRLPLFLGTPSASNLISGGGGVGLVPPIQSAIENSLQVKLDSVRVHTDSRAHTAARNFSARAFTYGNHIFLGQSERATDLGLMAHEAAHVVQQQAAPRVQKWSSRDSSDACEHEAHRASAAVLSGQSFTVSERTSKAGVQRWGIRDALNYFVDHANAIPGFRMFTIVLGVNPLNMSPVDRSAANILRAVVEFIPGGSLVTRALDNYGIFDRVGGWVEEQIHTLGMTGSAIRRSIDDFLHSLSWSDIFNLGGVWDRARRIVTEPIERLINFAGRLATGILGFIRDAILRPLAARASQTRGWDLLKAVLGRDPITGDPVPRTAETVIGGFMRLIEQEEVWRNIQRANAIPRAWAWFQGALEGLLGFVRQIPSLFIQALHELELTEIIVFPLAFAHIGRVFAGFAVRFVSWAGQQVWNLLQIIFEVVAPGVMPYLRRAAGAFRTIVHDPIGFIRNLVRAGIQGFHQFAAHFLTHLRASLISWLTGTLAGANIYIPQGFTFLEIIKFVLSVLGLTWQNIRQKLVRRIGETAVRALEIGFDLVVTLVRDGPAAAWHKIQEHLSNLREMVMEQVMTFVRERIVEAAIRSLITSLNPAGAFIQAIIAIYNTIMFFVERLRQIAQVAAAFIDSISAIANGVITAAANRVEQTMAGMLTLVISFLARIVGLGRVSDVVVNTVNRIREPIDRALDRVVDWIVTMAQRAGRAIVSGARTLVQRAIDLLRIRRVFRSSTGENHSLYFEQRGNRIVLVIATNPVLFRAFINSIGNNASLSRDKAYAVQLIDEIDRLEDDTRTNNVDHNARIVELVEEVGRTTVRIMSGASRYDVRTTSPVFAGLRNDFGRSMRVTLVTNDLRVGTPPAVSSSIWDDLNLRRRGRGAYYMKGHLLSEKLGGPGNTWENLTPLSRSGNNLHEDRVENFIKPESGDTPRAFLYVATPTYGRTLNRTLINLINAPTNPDTPAIRATKVRIVSAEQYVPTNMVCSIREINLGGGRSSGMINETYSVPNDIDQSDRSRYEL